MYVTLKFDHLKLPFCMRKILVVANHLYYLLIIFHACMRFRKATYAIPEVVNHGAVSIGRKVPKFQNLGNFQVAVQLPSINPITCNHGQ